MEERWTCFKCGCEFDPRDPAKISERFMDDVENETYEVREDSWDMSACLGRLCYDCAYKLFDEIGYLGLSRSVSGAPIHVQTEGFNMELKPGGYLMLNGTYCTWEELSYSDLKKAIDSAITAFNHIIPVKTFLNDFW